jgi:hypothetical protein
MPVRRIASIEARGEKEKRKFVPSCFRRALSPDECMKHSGYRTIAHD